MKTFFLTLLSIFAVANLSAQENNLVNCPKPTKNKFSELCLKVESQDLTFEQTLLELACANYHESEETKKKKVQKMWNNYKNEFNCNTEGLNVKDGNLIKMAVASNFMEFSDSLVKDYELDINFQDIDGRNVLDFTKDEIIRLQKSGGQKARLSELEGIYNYLKEELNAKHSPNYKPKTN